MENDEKKKNNPAIDEDYLMSMMSGGKNKTPEPQIPEETQTRAPAKERGRQKSNNEANYEALFFKTPDTNARNGKSVYIRPEFHERLSRIVQVIGEDKLTIYAYLDNVLEHHFHQFAEQIITTFNEKYKPIL